MWSFVAQNSCDRAKPIAESLLRCDAGNASAAAAQACCVEEMEGVPAALPFWESAEHAATENDEYLEYILTHLAGAYYECNEYAKYDLTMSRLAAVRDLDRDEQWRWGCALNEVGDTTGALFQLRRAAELSRENPSAYVRILQGIYPLELEMGDGDSARATLETIIAIAPGNCNASLALADLYAESGAFEKAEGLCRQVLDVESKAAQRVHVIEALVSLLYEKGDYEECERVCRRSLEEWPSSDGILQVLVRCLYAQSEFEKAAESVITLLEMKPREGSEGTFRDVVWAIQILMDAGRYVEATDLLKSRLSSCPKSMLRLEALTMLSYCLQMLGRVGEAEEFLRQVAEDAPSASFIYAQTIRDLGELALLQGNLLDAVPYLSDYCELNQQDSIAHFKLAEALEALGREKQARIHWKQVVSLLDPGSPWHRKAVRRLQTPASNGQ